MQPIPIQTVPKRIILRFSKLGSTLPSFSNGFDFSFIISRINCRAFDRIINFRKPSTFEEFEEILRKDMSFKTVTSAERCKLLYGDKIGKEKWDQYRSIQRETNTLEYKAKKYGMTKAEFDAYNKSRACTAKIFKERYGELEGNKKWKEYCDRQRFTNTKEYLGNRFETINAKKANTLENFQKRYGRDKGKQQFEKFIHFSSSGFSKISQELFIIISDWSYFKGKNIYFATHNHEYGVYDERNKRYFKYDFVCLELNLCIEFHGDHYHGNPEIYRPNQFLRGRGQTKRIAKDAWKSDLYKTNLILEKRGYETIVVWENHWRSDKETVLEKLKENLNERIKRINDN